jgi:CheY-like chemotaxis protein
MGDRQPVALVVDDEAADLTVITRILEVACGFSVVGARKYADAVAVFEAHADDISFLVADVSLPGRTGIELARTLLKKKPGLKVLLISGYVGAAALRLRGIQPGDPHFLSKPFKSSELVNRVRDLQLSDEPAPWLESDSAGGTPRH